MSRLRKNKYVRRFVRRLGGARLIIALRLLQLPLRLAVRLVVARLPRNPQLVVFGAPLDRFADNASYLFLQMSATPGLRCVWITGSRELVRRLRAAGYESELRASPAGLRTCLRAGCFVVTAYASDVNRWAADGARLFNLWARSSPQDHRAGHGERPDGVPSHRASPSFAAGTGAVRRNARAGRAVVDVGVVSRRCFSSAFGVPPERCLDFGYPRTDHFFAAQDEPPSPLLIKRPETWRRVRDARFVVGYFPTWRDDDSPFMQRSGLSVERLAETVAARDGVLLFKPHFNTAVTLPEGSAVVLHPDDDLNAYLPLCSALITDYSSVAFDFMLLDRPILYFVPDTVNDRENSAGAIVGIPHLGRGR